jgi:hypothetical protein
MFRCISSALTICLAIILASPVSAEPAGSGGGGREHSGQPHGSHRPRKSGGKHNTKRKGGRSHKRLRPKDSHGGQYRPSQRYAHKSRERREGKHERNTFRTGSQRGGYSGGGSFRSGSGRKDVAWRQRYAEKHRCKFEGGYCYEGHNHRHWSVVSWNKECRCNFFTCPSSGVEYYWCAPDNCYYPKTYCPYNCFAFCWSEGEDCYYSVDDCPCDEGCLEWSEDDDCYLVSEDCNCGCDDDEGDDCSCGCSD